MTQNQDRGKNLTNQKRRIDIRFAFLAALLLSVFSITIPTWGQGAIGTIVGRVTDASGAVVSGAAVIVTNVATNVAVHTNSTTSGDFTVPYLSPAVYRVTVKASGFKTAETKQITLGVGQTVRADIALKIGAASQTVTVNAGALSLDTENAAVGQVISRKQILDLPMENRSFGSLLLLSPGATTTVTNGALVADLPGETTDLGGARAASNMYLIDGMTNDDPYFTPPVINLSLDAIQEFKEQSSTYSAQYGGAAGQINILVKSGTNDLHGTLFEFIRNNDFDARSYFTPTGTKNPPLHQNDYGYSLGGPVYIPKLYNGRDRSFFFANFERLVNSTSVTEYSTAPTSNELQGIVPSATPILDPTTGTPFPTDSNGNFLIPQSRWARLAVVANKTPGDYWPIAGATTVNGFNSVAIVTNPSFNNQQTYKFDQVIGSKDHLSARFSLQNSGQTIQSYDVYGAAPSTINTQTFNVIETHIFNPHLVNQARVGWFSYNDLRAAFPAPIADLNALGLQNSFPLAGQGFPTFGAPDFSTGGAAFGLPTGNGEGVWNGEDSIAWTHGNHYLTLGFLAYFDNGNTGPIDIADGDYTFDGSYTAPAGDVPTAGNQWADYLLGDIITGQASVPTGWGISHPVPPPWYLNQRKYSGYAQDDWRATRKLTLNLGLRYDYQSIPDNEQAFWPSLTVPGGVACINDKAYVDSGDGGTLFQYGGSCNRSTPKKPFAPRVGFAFDPTGSGKNVIRGGYGMFFDQFELYEWASQINYPWVEAANAGHQNFDNLFPAPTALVTASNLAGLYNVQPASIKDPYIEEWSLSVERSLNSNTTLNVGYVGSEGTHLNTRVPMNQPNGYSASDTPAERMARYPFYNFGTYGVNGTPFSPGFVLQNVYGFSSNYNALDVSLNHRSKDLVLLASYTWSSAMDSGSSSGCAGLDCNEAGWQGPMDAHDFRRDYSKSSYDVPQRIVVSFVYNLPFGRGERFASTVNRATSEVIGGWQVNGIYSAQTGIPFSIRASDIGAWLEANGQRANRNGNPPSSFHKSAGEWFDTSLYSQPAVGVFGNAHRNDTRAAGLNNLDFSLFKNFPISERARFQLRVEAFNAFNHTQLGAPDPSVSSPTFGKISSVNVPGRIVQIGGKIIF